MPARYAAPLFTAVFFLSSATGLIAQTSGGDLRNANDLHQAAEAYQRAVDRDPSSAKAHEGLGAALAHLIISGYVRPSNDDDTVARAENHLKQAIDLAPQSRSALNELSSLEAFLAGRSTDGDERSDRYARAASLLKQSIDLDPNNPRLYFHLASVERDNFGPPIQQASGRFTKAQGPIADATIRKQLQSQYANVIEDAISNAKTASQLNGTFTPPLLLLSRIYRERALIRDTPGEFNADMQLAAQYKLQFLSAGGHADQDDSSR